MQGRPKEGAALYLEALATLKKRVCAGLGVEVLFLGVTEEMSSFFRGDRVVVG